MADLPVHKIHEKSYGHGGARINPAGSEVECRPGTVAGPHMEPVNHAAKDDAWKNQGGRKFFGGWRPPITQESPAAEQPQDKPQGET